MLKTVRRGPWRATAIDDDSGENHGRRLDQLDCAADQWLCRAPGLVCRLLVVRAVVSAMKHRNLIVTSERNIWWVRLDGVEVVSFFGPHAQKWAFRERAELTQLLEAQPDADLDEQNHRSAHSSSISRKSKSGLPTKACRTLSSRGAQKRHNFPAT